MKSKLPDNVLVSKAKALAPIVQSIVKTTSKPKTSGHVVLSLDYDGCCDLLQTQRGIVYPNTFAPRAGYAHKQGINAARVAIAHYFLRALLEELIRPYKSVTLVNSSYEQSAGRTREFGLIAKTYGWLFNNVRNKVKIEKESHAAFKKRTFLGHMKTFPTATKFVFFDDLKRNVNSVSTASNKVIACKFDYSSYVSGLESIVKFVSSTVSQLPVNKKRYVNWANKLKAI
jgi:hypothetical protein